MEQESIHVLMSKVMSSVSHIEKAQRNEHFNYNFRGIDDVLNALHRPLSDHGVFYLPTVLEHDVSHTGKQYHATVKVQYTFYGPKGDSVSSIVVAEGLDTSDKAATKAMSTALKYALLQVFCIPTEEQRENDPDAQGDTAEKVAEPEAGPRHEQTSSESVPAQSHPSPPRASDSHQGFWDGFAKTTGFPKGQLLKRVREFPEGKDVLSLEDLNPDAPAGLKLQGWAKENRRVAEKELAATQ